MLGRLAIEDPERSAASSWYPAAPRKAGPSTHSIENLFIGISGIIGAGKSTLARALGEHLGMDVYYVPVATTNTSRTSTPTPRGTASRCRSTC
jgi:putative protein kinase ArgK-like GTPase of G3E family